MSKFNAIRMQDLKDSDPDTDDNDEPVPVYETRQDLYTRIRNSSPVPSSISQESHCSADQLKFNIPDEPAFPSSPPPPSPSTPSPSSGANSEAEKARKRKQKVERLVKFFTENWIIITVAILICVTLTEPGFFAGFLWGIFSVALSFYMMFQICFPIDRSPPEAYREPIYAAPVPEDPADDDRVIYKGWMNLLRSHYDPRTFSISSTRSALVRLDKDIIRISLPKINVGKHSVWNESFNDPPFVSQELFSIAGAKIVLRPKHLARRRWWSRKYPLCIYVYRNAMIKGVRHTLSDTIAPPETNAAPPSDSESGDDENESQQSKQKTKKPTKPTRPASTNDLATKQGKSSQSGAGESNRRKKLYLFARSPREKEQWFHRIKKAISQHSYKKEKEEFRGSHTDTENVKTERHQQFLDWLFYDTLDKQFAQNMRAAGVQELPSPVDALGHNMQLNSHQWKANDRPGDRRLMHEENIVWLNALFSRIHLDFAKDVNWINIVLQNIERKLSSIHLPYFIESLKLSKLEPGLTTPKIVGVYEPYFNEWGLWFDLNIVYNGDLRLALETKVNLMKLKTDKRPPHLREQITRYWDDEVPESPESSEDEAASKVPLTKQKQTEPRETKGRKFMNFLDRITNSKYFQEATENEFVQKLMKGVSDTPFTLMVDVMRLEGTLAINVPQPPSDRLWYGFRSPPKVSVKARPKVGERAFNLTQVTEFIENKLVLVIEKLLVLPNMDDFVIPLMAGNPLLYNINIG